VNTFILANPHKCIGCKACEIACAIAHLGTDIHTAAGEQRIFSPRINLVRAARVTMPIQCRQCEDATCAQVCPVHAIIQAGNRIEVHGDLCIGCKACMDACPFGAMDMAMEEREQGILEEATSEGSKRKKVMVAHKCDLCTGRIAGPACVEVCPAEAFVVVHPQRLLSNIKEKRMSSAREMMSSRR
jgi:electron transport protein HydN